MILKAYKRGHHLQKGEWVYLTHSSWTRDKDFVLQWTGKSFVKIPIEYDIIAHLVYSYECHQVGQYIKDGLWAIRKSPLEKLFDND